MFDATPAGSGSFLRSRRISLVCQKIAHIKVGNKLVLVKSSHISHYMAVISRKPCQQRDYEENFF